MARKNYLWGFAQISPRLTLYRPYVLIRESRRERGFEFLREKFMPVLTTPVGDLDVEFRLF